jgi:hypothetical protein
MPNSGCFLVTAVKLKAKDNYLAAIMLLFYILLPQQTFHRSILKGSDNGVLPLIDSGFWTLSIIQCFPKKHNVSETGSVETTFILPEGGNRSSFRNVVFFEKTLDNGLSPKTLFFQEVSHFSMIYYYTSFYLMTETDPFSKMLCVFRTSDDGQSPKT